MSNSLPAGEANENEVTVRYWAAARAAAGVETERVSGATLADVIAELRRRHRENDRFADVIATCSILVGEIPVGSRNAADVKLTAGDHLEFLPPFAGGAS